MVGIPADIVLSTLTTPPIKALEAPLISTHPLKRDGTRGSLVPGAPAFTTAKTASSITATITSANGATSYEHTVDGTSWVAGLVASGLAGGQSYPFQLRGINEHGTGDPSAVVNISTSAGQGTVASFTPMVAENFAAGTLGASSPNWRRSQYNADIAVSGGKSLKLSTGVTEVGSCPADPVEYHYFANRQNLPALITPGQTVWQRVYFYFPSTFSFGYLWETGNQTDIDEAAACGIGSVDGNVALKFLVFSANVGNGRNYLLVTSPKRQVNQPADAIFRLDSGETGGTSSAGGGYVIPRDRWLDIQFAVHVQKDNTGWMRAWADGVLIDELLNVQTLNAASDGLDEWGIGDYWNGYAYTDGQPGRSDFYIDEILVATDADGYGAPTDVDANGNVYIASNTRAAHRMTNSIPVIVSVNTVMNYSSGEHGWENGYLLGYQSGATLSQPLKLHIDNATFRGVPK